MKKIVSVIKPFVMQQNIFVYEDGNKIDIISTDINNIENALMETAAKYDIKEINLAGSKKFSEGVRARVQSVDKYTNDIEIKIIK